MDGTSMLVMAITLCKLLSVSIILLAFKIRHSPTAPSLRFSKNPSIRGIWGDYICSLPRHTTYIHLLYINGSIITEFCRKSISVVIERVLFFFTGFNLCDFGLLSLSTSNKQAEGLPEKKKKRGGKAR